MIDLHMHTYYSDGDKSVKEILELCQEQKLEYISITDHNTCKAYEEVKSQNIFSGNIITGIELTASHEKRIIEILGYDIDTKGMQQWCEQVYSQEKLLRKIEVLYERFLKKLEKRGIQYDKKRIPLEKFDTDFIERPIWNEIKRNPQNETKMEPEFWNDFSDFFRKGLTNPDNDWFIGHSDFRPTAKEIVELIHEMNGKAFLAHAYQYKFHNTLKQIERIRQTSKLDGLECYYSNFTKEQTNEIVEYTTKNHLYKSGGSDFHGKRRPEVQVGIGKGDLAISKEIIKDWKEV